MRVLDLFSGMGGFSQAFRDRGHEVITIDNDYTFSRTYTRDIGQLTDLSQFGQFDVILASPPCQAFSIASVYLHWKNHEPDNAAKKSIALVQRTLQLIEMAQPKFWIMENPRGMLRKVIGKPQAEVSYCQYGTAYMKPTDLWGMLPPSFIPKKCRPKRSHPSWWKTTEQNDNSCPHEESPKNERGWNKNGLLEYGSSSWKRKQQGAIASTMRAPALRALIPYQLSLAICEAMERDLV